MYSALPPLDKKKGCRASHAGDAVMAPEESVRRVRRFAVGDRGWSVDEKLDDRSETQ